MGRPRRVRQFITTKSVRRNTLANLIARVVSAGLALAAIPILLSKLGPEAYGLVGLAVALESLIALLDLGLSTAVNREVARNLEAGRPPESNRDLLRTLEVIYWPIGLVILVIVVAGSGWLASRGLHTAELPPRTVQFSLAVIAFTLTIRWPMSLYVGVLRGLQAQVLQNGLQVLGTVIRLVGGVIVVTFVSPTVEAFFLTDLVGSVVQVAAFAGAAWLSLPSSRRPPRFQTGIVRSLWRFALAFNGIVILGQLLQQSGTLLVARLLPLEDVGYYAVALSLAGVVVYVPYALVEASFPRFTAELESRDKTAFRNTYRIALGVSAVSIVAIAIPIAFFSEDLLYVWTRSRAVATKAAAAASMLAIGNLLYALWAFPYTALLSAGLVRFPLVVYLIVVPLALVASPFVISSIGLVGAGAVWAVASAIFLSVFPVALDRRVAETDGISAWGRPIAMVTGSTAVCIVVAQLTQDSSPIQTVVVVGLIAVLMGGAALFWLQRSGYASWASVQESR